MRLTRKAFRLLKKRYASILLRCRLTCLAIAACALPALPSQAATLSVSASGGAATISSGGVYSQLNITGAANPVVNITKPLTLTGLGAGSSIITAATSAHLRVIDTSFRLGSATNAPGGTLRGDIYLDRGTLRVYGNANTYPSPVYNLAAGGNSTGGIAGNGEINLRANAILQSGAIGTEAAPVSAISVDEQCSLQAQNGIYANQGTINEGGVTSRGGDIHIKTLDLNGAGSTLQATTGDIHIDNVLSISPDNELMAQTGINADEGSIHIGGDLNLEKGLTALRAGKDIIIANGEGSLKGPGELYIRAGGHVQAGSSTAANSNIEALRMSIGGELTAKNALAAQLSANTVHIGQNLTIQGNSVRIFGTPVEYGKLEITGRGNSVGGDLGVYDAEMDITDLAVAGNAILSATRGKFDSLTVGKTLDFAAGNLTGNNLNAAQIRLGESQYASSLKVASATFNSLYIGNGGILRADSITAPYSPVRLENGGRLVLTSGDLGSASRPAGIITLGQNSNLAMHGAIHATGLLGVASTGNTVSANGDIDIQGPIRGSLAIHTPANASATSVSAVTLSARNATITSGALNLTSYGNIGENLRIYGPGELWGSPAQTSGSFTRLRVGNLLELAGSHLTGDTLTVGTALVGSSKQSASLRVANISRGFGLGVGHNGWVTLGTTDSSWLASAIDRSPSRISANSAVGVYRPVIVGPAGVILNPAQARPTPARGALEFAPDSLLVINAPNAREDLNSAGIISATELMNARVRSGARLLLDGVEANRVYGVLGSNIATTYESATAWDESRLETGAHLIGIRKIPDRNGWFASYIREPETVYPGIDPGIKPPLQEGHKPPATSAPTRPTTPSVPAAPGVTPSNPTTPAAPGVTPSNPATPDMPDQTPANPANPGDTPANPATPGESPVNPGQQPATPGNPSQSPTAPEITPVQPGPALGVDDAHFNSDYAGVRFLSRVGSIKYMDHQYDKAWKTIEAAARMAILAAVPQLTYSANMGAVEAAQSRASFANQAGNFTDEMNGRAIALWILPMYRNLQGYDLEAYNLGYDLSGGLGGISLGMDLTFGDSLRAGIDASIGGGYARSGGDLATTTNNMGFTGVGAYVGWLGERLGLGADLHFTSSWNSIKQEFPCEIEMRNPTGELTSRALSAGFRAEYRIPLDNWQIAPHAGVRFANVHTDNYSIYSNGAMIDGQAIDQNIWTFPFGISLSGDIIAESGWNLRPTLDALVTPATGDVFANTKLRFTGVPGEANIDTQTMDYWRYGGSVGFLAKKDNFSLGVNYQIQAGSHTTEQNVFGSLIYEF